MQHSTDRMYTTHVGSLARPSALLDLMRAGAAGEPVDETERAEAERQAVADVVARQRAAGLDVISDGEQTRLHTCYGINEGPRVLRPSKAPTS